jgi:hypothetical protein
LKIISLIIIIKFLLFHTLGHVYAIADCGGATTEGTCPECGSAIGGGNHRLREDNRFFGEMDGAQHPAWSEQANLGNYGFNAEF